MESSFKLRSFSFVYWVMLIFLVGDTLDTAYRFIVIGYFGNGATFPGAGGSIKPDTIDLVVFLLTQVGIVGGVCLLYNMKRIGGVSFYNLKLLFFSLCFCFWSNCRNWYFKHIYSYCFVFFFICFFCSDFTVVLLRKI